MTARPTLHLAPAAGWLNDPNGMAFHDGRWHVFYQHNPAGPVHDAIAWGHASSDDLVRWHHHPVAFAPTPGGPDRFGCWSGVLVVDDGRPAAVYSGVVDTTLASTVCLRRSDHPRLETWTDPVVVARTPDADDVAVMRDPFVFTWRDRRWSLMGAGLSDGRAAVLLFSCDDLLDWTYEGVLLTSDDAVAGSGRPADVWECPQLALDGDDALLLLSVQLGGVLDTVQAVSGRLEEGEAGRPRLVAEALVDVDTGDSLYAPQLAADPDGTWFLGWVREDAHETGDPANAGCLSFPRRLTRDDGTWRWRLAPQLDAALGPGEDTASPLRVDAPARVRAAGAWTLTGTTLQVSGADADVWLDGEVVEVHPHDRSAPATYRDPGTAAWTVDGDALTRSVPAPSTP